MTENKNSVEYASYQQVNLYKNEQRLPEILTRLNGRIVLLKSFHSMRDFERGRLAYDETDSKVCYL
jgi:hypothetical protein